MRLKSEKTDTVVIVTRHDSHARQVVSALQAGKNVFCEKPLCLTEEELLTIEKLARERSDLRVMVGFNRRFSPLVVKAKALLDTVMQPKSLIMTVNAGEIPPDHWTQDRAVGGGRIIGEGCHFIDLLRYLIGHPIVESSAFTQADQSRAQPLDDKTTIVLRFADGSVGTVHYLANGHKGFPKERLEAFCGGKVLQLDNFRKLKGWGWKGFKRLSLWRQDKGQTACAKSFIDAIKEGNSSPIPLEEIIEVTRTSIEVAEKAYQQ